VNINETKKGGGLKKNFTLLEVIVVVIILGILSALAVNQYNIVIERRKGKVAETVLRTIREAVVAFKANEGDTEGIGNTSPSWNPNATNLGSDSVSDQSWRRIGITNPNNENEPFLYDYVDGVWGGGEFMCLNPPDPFIGQSKIIAQRKGSVCTKYIIIRVSDGVISRTKPYN
jgi:prepilin-type N-terminal cleavage/methylation domain-containing protein